MAGRAYRPLAGVRVLSFEIAFALPAGTRTLAELGADVVRVAPPARAVGNYIGVVDGVFQRKPCVSIDLQQEQGRALALDLALAADVVCDNFRASVLPKFGLDAATLRARKPGLIVLKLSGYGSPGPWSDFPAFGPSTEAAGGMNRTIAGEEATPLRVGSGVFSDQLAGRFAALSLLAALHQRHTTGQGATIDLSMTECIAHLIGPHLAYAARHGRPAPAHGNRDRRYVPQGVYRCRGDDQWIAVSVQDDAAWARLVDLVGEPGLRDPALATAAGRWDTHDRLDALLDAWTRGFDKDALAARLQAARIAAGPVRDVRDMHDDAQLRARRAFSLVRHQPPVLGQRAHPHVNNPWVVAGRERLALTDYRWNGRDNARVLKSWLNLGDDAIRALAASGALRSAGRLVVDEPPVPRALHDPEHARRLQLP